MRRLPVTLLVLAALAFGTAAARPQWAWDLPPGISPPATPPDNPMTQAKVDLGRRLFYDGDLSLDGTMSCASCHDQKRAFADGTRSRAGVHGDPGRRNAPALGNVAYLGPLTWADPVQTTLERQALVPLFGENPVEMGMKGHEAELLRRLSSNACYRQMFSAAFPETRGRIDIEGVTRALASFQRSMVSYETPYDRYRAGDLSQLSASAQRGAAAFQANCATCHSGPNFSDGRFHRLEGMPPGNDRGLAEITGIATDTGKFRTPGLRNVALTAPYMHDGSIDTLTDAIARHGSSGGRLSQQQQADIIDFLDTLTDRPFITDKKFAYPDEACGEPL